LFASASSAVDLRTHLAGFCDPLVLDLPEQGRPEEAARLAAVFCWLGQNPGWLLILDNADTSEAAAEVEKMLPRLHGTTTFNGVNDRGQIVGFYVNGAGNTIGLLATPVR
jgi:hypothetical protein